MAKVFLVDVQPWTTNDRKTGEPITGKSYIGYLPTGTAIKFTCKEDYPTHVGEVGYQEAGAVDIPLLTKFFGGKINYQCGKCYGKS